VAHAPDAPRTMLHGRMLRCRRDRALEGDDTVPRADLDGGCMDGGISIENQAHGIADGIVAIFLGGLDAEGVDHISSSRNPPGEGTSEPFLGEARHLAGGRNDTACDRHIDPPYVGQWRWTILNCPRMCSRIVHPVSARSSTKALRERS